MKLNSRAMYYMAAENSAVFKRGLKEASEAADRRSDLREFHTEGTAVEKAPDAKHKATAGFENRKAGMMTELCARLIV